MLQRAATADISEKWSEISELADLDADANTQLGFLTYRFELEVPKLL